ncbi:MAG: FAD-dependent thymidylate synthase [Alphaproteobacteria bacterium]
MSGSGRPEPTGGRAIGSESQPADSEKPTRADKKAEIEAARSEHFTTRRATVPALEEILYEQLAVLDHGFVRVVDYMGSDAAIVQAARVSYGTGTKQVRQDRGLIRYLLRHRHTTPFEMCEIKYHVKLPVFVARQWIRHRTANVNEYSARYSIMEDEFYIPAREDLAAQSQTNRQGRGEVLNDREAARVLEILRDDAARCYGHYEEMLNERADATILDPDRTGLARELARMNLTLNVYTQWYWKIDLHNLLHFLSLRADAHSQYEIRAYANVMLDTVRRWVPYAYEAFDDYVMGGAHVSRTGMEVIRRLIGGETVTQEDSGLTKREWRELMELLERPVEDGE